MEIAELFNQQGVGFETKGTVPGLQIFGGSWGFQPDFKNRLLWHSYVKKPMISIVLQTPQFVNLLPEPNLFHGSFKSLFEKAARQVTGIKSTIRAEYSQTEISRNGEYWQDPIMVKRERSEPVYIWDEKLGKPINKILDFWIRWGIEDPDIGIPLISTIDGAENYQKVSSNMACTILHIEPDPIHRGVMEAWLNFNMMPDNGGEVEGLRQGSQALGTREVQAQFTSTQLVGTSVVNLATDIMKEMNMRNLDPGANQIEFNSRHADVAAIMQEGYAETLNIANAT